MTYSELINHLCKSGERFVTQIYLRPQFTCNAFHKTYVVQLPLDQDPDVYCYWITVTSTGIADVSIVLDAILEIDEHLYTVNTPDGRLQLTEFSSRMPELVKPTARLNEPTVDWRTDKPWTD